MIKHDASIPQHPGKLPRDLSYPLRYADVQACAALFKAEVVHLYSIFRRRAHFNKTDRDEARESLHHRLVDWTYEKSPGPESLVYPMYRSSEAETIEIGVVVWIFAIPRAELRAAGAKRFDIQTLVHELVQQLVTDQETLARSNVAISLDVTAKALHWKRTDSRHGVTDRLVENSRNL